MHKRMFLVTIIAIGLVFLLVACGGAAPTEAPAATVVDRYPNGVAIELPDQESGARLQSKETVLANPLPNDVAGEYEFIGPIMYLDVYDEGEKPVYSFSPPIVLYVDIPADLRDLAESEKLVILLYDTISELWIPCDGKNQTDNTQCSATNFTEDFGQAWITIDKWTSGTGWGK